jgi:hypothetical protein
MMSKTFDSDANGPGSKHKVETNAAGGGLQEHHSIVSVRDSKTRVPSITRTWGPSSIYDVVGFVKQELSASGLRLRKHCRRRQNA